MSTLYPATGFQPAVRSLVQEEPAYIQLALGITDAYRDHKSAVKHGSFAVLFACPPDDVHITDWNGMVDYFIGTCLHYGVLSVRRGRVSNVATRAARIAPGNRYDALEGLIPFLHEEYRRQRA